MLVIASILGVCVAKAGNFRLVAVIIYTLILMVIIGALILWLPWCSCFAKGNLLWELKDMLESAWINTVAVEKDDACQIQEDFACFGFNDNFCVGCGAFNSSDIRDCSEEQAPQCPICLETLPNTTRGCYGALVNATQRYYNPIGTSSAVVAGVLLFDAVVVFAI